MKKRIAKKISLTVCIALLISILPVGQVSVSKAANASPSTEAKELKNPILRLGEPSKETSHGLNNPRNEGGTVTWDCVCFGNYWQRDTNGDGKADKNDTKEPIKWRVLSVNGDEAFLLADQTLDMQRYNDTETGVTWETCTMRSWLNGYGADANQEGKDYGENNFLDNAFTSSEQAAIQNTLVVNEDNLRCGTEGGNDTTDKVYLLSLSEVMDPLYGFASTNDEYNYSDTREVVDTAYVAAGGEIQNSARNSYYWSLRSPGGSHILTSLVHDGDHVSLVGNGGDVLFGGGSVASDNYAVRPVLYLNLSSSDWSKVGTVSSDGGEMGVTWDCIYFGNYWKNDTNGDKRVDKNDKKEPIKWRVLSVNGNDAFLLADENLDKKWYNDKYSEDVTWETCTMRSWLNGYGADANQEGKDYSGNNFLNNAFSPSEQAAIQKTLVVNEDNPEYCTEGGNNTSDKVYLLSISEVKKPAYGFALATSSTDTRETRNTEYAGVGGTNGAWWLRSPGVDNEWISYVGSRGGVDLWGDLGSLNRYGAGELDKAVRPALHINLSSPVWSYAGTVSSDGKVKEPGIKTSDTYKKYKNASAYQDAYAKKMPHSWKEILADGKDGIDFTKSFAQPGVITTNYTKDDENYLNDGNYIPQGICYVGDKDNEKKYRIISAYNQNSKKLPSVLYVMQQNEDKQNYTYLTTLVLNETTHTHNGGVAFDGENLWICNANEYISYIKYATLEQAIQKAADSGVYSVLVKYDNQKPIRVAKHPSFLTYAHEKLWIGTWKNGDEKKEGVLIGYEIQNKESEVKLSENIFINNLPSSSQGAYIEGDDLYVSSSYGSKKIKNTSRIARYSVPGMKKNRVCIQLGEPEDTHEVPKMNEEILIDGDWIYTVFESSANEYKSSRLITDRVLAFQKSFWEGNSSRSKKARTSDLADAKDAYEEGTEETVAYRYDFNEQVDERETEFSFTPSETGTYKIKLSGLEAEEDLYAHLEIEDADVCTYGVLSTCTDEEPDSAGTEAEGEFVLSEGITYYFSMYVDSLSSADAFSGQYTFKAERVGGLDVQEVSSSDKTVVTELNEEMNYIRFVPEESGYYRICSTLSSDVEMGGLRVMKDFKEEIALNDDCVYLNKGEEYYILFEVEGIVDAETAVTVWMEPYVSETLTADEILSVTGSSVLEYVAEEEGEVIVYSSSNNENPTVFVYDEAGNLISCSSNSGYNLSDNENDFAAVFAAEKGEKYQIIVNTENTSQMEINIGNYEEVTNPEPISTPSPAPTSTPTSTPAATPTPSLSEKPVSSQKPTPTATAKETTAPKESEKPVSSQKPTPTAAAKETKAPEESAKPDQIAASDNSFVAKNITYKITNAAKNTVSCIGSTKKSVVVTIPDTVKTGGKKYKVTAIANNAFKGQKKLKKITIGKNVKSIGKNAFRGCKKLKVITVRGKKLKKVGRAVLKGIHGKAVIKVPKAKKKQYAKLFRKKGQKKSVRIV